MTPIKAALLAGALSCLVGAAAAQPGPDGPPREETRADVAARADQLFGRLDANHDGRVMADEVSGMMEGGPGMGPGGAGGPAAMFDRLDTDHNGSLSRQEFAAMRPPLGEPAGPGGFGMGRGGGGGAMLARMIGPDGLTRDELRARMLQRFDRLDANHDGRLTGEERQQARARMDGMRGQRPMDGPDRQGDQ